MDLLGYYPASNLTLTGANTFTGTLEIAGGTVTAGAANVLAATRADVPSGIANICTGRSTSLLDVVAVFARHYPAAPAVAHAAPRTGDIIHSLGAPDLAAEALGFRAQVSVETGLGELIQTG